jgi:hypothetical protein
MARDPALEAKLIADHNLVHADWLQSQRGVDLSDDDVSDEVVSPRRARGGKLEASRTKKERSVSLSE